MDGGPVVRGRDILFLVSTLHIGGSERKTVRLANALTALGHRVVIAHLNGPETLRAELSSKVRVVNLHRTGKFSLGALRGLSDLIEGSQVDTVVCVNLYPTLYAGLLAKFSRRLPNVRFIASINTTEFRSVGSKRRMLLYRPLLRGMDLLMFGAEYQRDLWQRSYFVDGAPRSCVLYNGIDVAHFSREATTAWRPPLWPSKRIVIGTVGRLRPEKSNDQLLHALAQLCRRGLDVGAVIVGDGEQESALLRLICELGLEDRVHLSGAANDVRPYLAGFDIYAMTSTAVETFSNATLEALAMGCPVVSSRIGGMPEMLSNGGGLTYETGNVEALANALYELASCAERRAAFARQTRDIVVQRFSLEAMVESFRRLIA